MPTSEFPPKREFSSMSELPLEKNPPVYDTVYPNFYDERQEPWRVINAAWNVTNQTETANLIEELSNDQDYKDHFMGTVCGMPVFEGILVIEDERKSNQLKRLKIRMVVGRDILFLGRWKGQYLTKVSMENDTLFAEMAYFITLLHSLTTGYGIPADAEYTPNQDGPISGPGAIAALIDAYDAVNAQRKPDEPEYPLTLLYGHGKVETTGQYRGRHMINAGKYERYPTHIVLQELIRRFPPINGSDKPPLLLTSCNETYGMRASFSHQPFRIIYLKGIHVTSEDSELTAAY